MVTARHFSSLSCMLWPVSNNFLNETLSVFSYPCLFPILFESCLLPGPSDYPLRKHWWIYLNRIKTLSAFPWTCSVDLIPMKVGGKHEVERDTSPRYKAFRATFIYQDQPWGRHMVFLPKAPRIQLLHLVISDFICSNHCHLYYCHRSNLVPLLTSYPPRLPVFYTTLTSLLVMLTSVSPHLIGQKLFHGVS